MAESAEDAWVVHPSPAASFTLLPPGASWCLGATVPGKPGVSMLHVSLPLFVAKCEDVVAKAYEGFVLR